MPAGPDGCSVCSGSRGYGGITALTEAFNVNKCISANKQLFNLHAYSFWFKTGMVGVLFVGHLTPYFHVCLHKGSAGRSDVWHEVYYRYCKFIEMLKTKQLCGCCMCIRVCMSINACNVSYL